MPDRDGEGRGVDARVIPLAAANPSNALRRARRLARGARRPLPGLSASVHPLPVAPPAPPPPASPSRRADRATARATDRATARAAELVDFLRRRLDGDYAVDDFGFDRDLAQHAALPLLRPLYERWFRVEVGGIEHVPAEGGALLVANHAGGLWPLDAAMTALAVHLEHPAGRHLRPLGADLIFATAGLGALTRKLGGTLACAADAERLLSRGELVGVWPEGFMGIGKPFRDRYKLQRFGRGGFVHAALRSQVPIIPVSIVGSEEIHPVLGNARLLARVFDLPYFPLTPTFPWLGPLGLVPLPSKWHIEFGEPVHTETYGPAAAEDAAVVFDLADRVRETIQSTLYRLLVQRRSIWR
ncbi:MAG: acyltransferase family protein [Actinobacteria bacterium]|nr:acyltransferase family protein [Actinomycetota bacterium]